MIIRNMNNDILVIEKNKDGKIGINYWLNIVHFELYVQIEKYYWSHSESHLENWKSKEPKSF